MGEPVDGGRDDCVSVELKREDYENRCVSRKYFLFERQPCDGEFPVPVFP